MQIIDYIALFDDRAMSGQDFGQDSARKAKHQQQHKLRFTLCAVDLASMKSMTAHLGYHASMHDNNVVTWQGN